MRATANARNLTALLRAWNEGDSSALADVVSVAYPELHRIAAAYLASERSGHTLQPTALVNELFLRLIGAHVIDWHDRVHFLAVAARVMRRVLVDHARTRGCRKRQQGDEAFRLEAAGPSVDIESVLALHHALEDLSQVDQRKEQVVELRYFGGLSVPEAAAVLGVSEDTVVRDWRLAKAWLLRHLTEGTGK